jgi:hypothetical protein
MKSMSTDPHGILFYGFPIPTPTVDYLEVNDSWAEEFRPPQPEDRSDYRSPEWDQWRTDLRVYEQTLRHVEITWSGGDGCEQYYVHCPALEKKVEWDEQREITIEDLTAFDDAERYLHEFCDRFNIPKGEPGWYLAALYF